MQVWFANLVYLVMYTAAAPWLLYRRLVEKRPLGNWRQRCLGSIPQRNSNQRCVWIHAVSVGEVNQLATLIPPLQRALNNWDFVLSTTTVTGMQLAEQKFPELDKFYCPIDFSWAVRRTLRRIRPDLLLLAELEIWPNLINLAHQQNIPIAVVNGRLSLSSHRRYQRIKPIVRPIFSKLDLVAAQNETYAERFVDLGCDPQHVQVTGSIKFDGTQSVQNEDQLDRLKQWSGLRNDHIVLVAGSTQFPEEQMFGEIFVSLKRRYPNLRIVVVPRHPHRCPSIARQLQSLDLSVRLRSELANELEPDDHVVLVDTIGELVDWWNIGTIAFVGGSFGSRGGQNMIEPAAAAAAVCFGPNTWNFADVVQLMLRHDVASQVNDLTQLESFITKCLDQPEWAKTRGENARELVLGQRGASDRIANLIGELLSEKDSLKRDRNAA